jgi:hypothetical protein
MGFTANRKTRLIPAVGVFSIFILLKTAILWAGANIVTIGTLPGTSNLGAGTEDYCGQVFQVPPAPNNYFLDFKCVIGAGPATQVRSEIYPFDPNFSEVTGTPVFTSAYVTVPNTLFPLLTFSANSPIQLSAGGTYIDVFEQSNLTTPSVLSYPDYGHYAGGNARVLFGPLSSYNPPFSYQYWTSLYGYPGAPGDSMGFAADFGTSTTQIPEPGLISFCGVSIALALHTRRVKSSTNNRIAALTRLASDS